MVAQPDAKWGEEPCAFVEVKPGAEEGEQDIIEFCRKLMARFKVPKRVVFCTLPKTSTGKIQKFLLRDQVKSTAAINHRTSSLHAASVSYMDWKILPLQVKTAKVPNGFDTPCARCNSRSLRDQNLGIGMLGCV